MTYLRVQNVCVAEGVVGKDVSAVVDLFQSQVHHWDGSFNNEAACPGGDVGEVERDLLSTSTRST